MSALAEKPFLPRSTGWTANDLDDPAIEANWLRGAYEIINGVLTLAAPAYFFAGHATFNLLAEIHHRLRGRHIGSFSVAVDLALDEYRVLRAGACFLSSADKKQQYAQARLHGKADAKRSRIYVPPTLVMESISPGHEDHDRVTKFAWYAEFGVENYWIIDAFQRTLDAYALDETRYARVDALAGDQTFLPPCFPDVSVDLRDVWPSDE